MTREPTSRRKQSPFIAGLTRVFAVDAALVATIALTLLLIGCGDQNVHVVTDPGGEVAAARAVRIGSACDPPTADACAFSEVTSTLPLPGGRTAIAPFGGAIFIVDSTGTVAGQLGRVGSGPGEYRSATHMQLGRADSVRIVDIAAFRISSVSSSTSTGESSSFSPRVDLDDVQVSSRSAVMLSSPGAEIPGSRVAGSLRTVGVESHPIFAEIEAITYRQRNSEFSRPRGQFAPTTQWCVAPNGQVAVMHGDSWDLTLIDSSGQSQIESIASLPRDSVLDEDIYAMISRVSRSPDSVVRRRAGQQRKSGVKIHPTLLELACDNSAIVVETSNQAWKGERIWRVLDWSGVELYRLIVPITARLSSVGHGRIVAMSYHEQDDQPFVEIYSLLPSAIAQQK